MPDAAAAAPVVAGVRVEVMGRIGTLNVFGAPVAKSGEKPGDARVEYIAQLETIFSKIPMLVYCRTTRKLKNRLLAGQHVTATGVILGAGRVHNVGGGTTPVAYMACSAVRRPPGEIGAFTQYAEKHGINIPKMVEEARRERKREGTSGDQP